MHAHDLRLPGALKCGSIELGLIPQASILHLTGLKVEVVVGTFGGDAGAIHAVHAHVWCFC